MPIQAHSPDKFLIDASDIKPSGLTAIDQVITERPKRSRCFDNRMQAHRKQESHPKLTASYDTVPTTPDDILKPCITLQ